MNTMKLLALAVSLAASLALGGMAISQAAPTQGAPAELSPPSPPAAPPMIYRPNTTADVINDLLQRGRPPRERGLTSTPATAEATKYCCDQFGCTQVDILHVCDPDMVTMDCYGDPPLCQPTDWPDD